MVSDVVEQVLSFWFEEGTVPGICEYRPTWFVSTPSLDAAIADRFGETFERAARGEFDHISDSPRGALALIIMLDQFPRNLFRNDARAFATDAKARAVCKATIYKGDDQKLSALQRIFCYLPLQHSEELEDQIRSVELFGSLGDDKMFSFIKNAAKRHLDIIERFGRFPHRNAVLNRVSSPEERIFLESEEGVFWTK